MRRSKLRLALVYGGRSAEHEVSLASARYVLANLDPARFEVLPLLIDREGRWRLGGSELGEDGAERGPRVLVVPGGSRRSLLAAGARGAMGRVDLVFPLLHGPCGEDGSIQGLARLAGLPCVGADLLGSAIGMDKDVAKRLLREAGLPVVPFRSFCFPAEAEAAYEELVEEFGAELFVKPAGLGSSVGVSRVSSREEYSAALEAAFSYDTKIIVEARIEGRELEVGVVGNDEALASLPGEIVSHQAFYTYEAKYLDEEGDELRIPAELDEGTLNACREAAMAAYQALCLRGMARVDLFLDQSGRVFVNEVNSLPGFTERSMFPRLWEASGVPPRDLLVRLVELALEDFSARRKLRLRPAALEGGRAIVGSEFPSPAVLSAGFLAPERLPRNRENMGPREGVSCLEASRGEAGFPAGC